MFGVDSSIERSEIRRDVLQDERSPFRGFARVESRQREQEIRQRPESTRESERAPRPHASVWDALDEIGREQGTPQEQSVSSEAMARIQERTTEQQQEREAVKIKQERLDREKQEREQERDIGLGYGF